MNFALSRCSFLGALAVVSAALSVSPVAWAVTPPEQHQKQFEIRFLSQMIDHHYGAVKMSELCAGRTVHPDLQAMCDQIETAQKQEIATMQQWLKTWYGVTHEPRLDGKMQQQVQQLSKLTGAAFEKAYLVMMVPHHAMALTMSTPSLLIAYHAELLNMNAMTVASQADEIVQMRLWLLQWYGIPDVDKDDQM
jgi:uncharacterized protein (DUF305 family)